MLEAKQIEGSKYISMLPKSEHPWKLATFNNYVFAINPEHPPMCLHEDGWKEVEFNVEDFQTKAGLQFQAGIRKAAKANFKSKIVGKFIPPDGRIARRLAKRR